MPSMTDGKPTYPPEWDKEPDDFNEFEDAEFDEFNQADTARCIRSDLEGEE